MGTIGLKTLNVIAHELDYTFPIKLKWYEAPTCKRCPECKIAYTHYQTYGWSKITIVRRGSEAFHAAEHYAKDYGGVGHCLDGWADARMYQVIEECPWPEYL